MTTRSAPPCASTATLDSHTQTSNRDRAPRVAGHDARRVDRANEQTTPTIQSPRAAAGAAFISGSARGEAVPRRDARDGQSAFPNSRFLGINFETNHFVKIFEFFQKMMTQPEFSDYE